VAYFAPSLSILLEIIAVIVVEVVIVEVTLIGVDLVAAVLAESMSEVEALNAAPEHAAPDTEAVCVAVLPAEIILGYNGREQETRVSAPPTAVMSTTTESELHPVK
jgi:hypothetical protein